jgi:hypothetical protein
VKEMNLTVKEKRRIESITKRVISMLPYLLLIIVSLIFVSVYGNSEDLMMKVIKVCLLIFNIFAIYALINKVIDLIREIRRK